MTLAALGVATCLLIIGQAYALVGIIVPVFTAGADLRDVAAPVVLLSGILVGRAIAAHLTESLALRASAGAKSELRQAAMRKIMQLGPAWLAQRNSGHLTQLLTRGVDGLDSYFSRYLPQLVLAVAVPVVATAVVLTQDSTAAVIVIVTVPLIPVFMILIGMYTQRRMRRQWRALAVLSGHFMDVLAGMATLKAFGRARAQAAQVRRVSEQYRRATLGVLRVSFLSSFVLELVAMLSVAMVAVSIGVRLVDGGISLRAGLLVLILVPEVYLPLRQVGVHYHAAAEGLGAAGQIIEILDQTVPNPGSDRRIPDLALSTIRLSDVTVDYGSRERPALSAATLEIRPGTTTALVGPSGSGKSTVLGLLEGFLSPTRGTVTVTGPGGEDRVDLADLDMTAWRAQVAWVGQVPRLIPGSLADNIRLAAPGVGDAEVLRAASAAGLAGWIAQLPEGISTQVGEGGRPVSQGQARRIAFARVICADPRLVLLDEPTASLDGPAEDLLIDEIQRIAEGRTVVVVAHREALVSVADAVIRLDQGHVIGEAIAATVGGAL